jgi:mannose-1-phosphate guanylyltransferase
VAELAGCPEWNRTIVLAEPAARNTAPAIALGIEFLRRRHGLAETVIVLTADHLIRPLEVFAEDVAMAGRLAARGSLVVFGVQPRMANTGYGYLEAGESLAEGFRVRRFREKPDQAAAESYLAAGNYYWNSGMFVFTSKSFLDEFARQAPDMAAAVAGLGFEEEAPGNGMRMARLAGSGRAVYAGLQSISFDYAVMEKCGQAALVPARFEWNDVGSWDEVSGLVAGDNCVRSVGGSGNFVLSDLPVGLCGVSDLIVVVSNGRVLVCSKGASQSVRDLASQVESRD